MSIHLATINGQPVDYNANTVRCMALHLLAGVTVGLDLSSDHDVIRYLINTPEQYRAAVVTSHMDAAIYSARQTLVGAIMGAM
jgi:ABC-type uncharacterized transport system ATPase subunit